MLNRSESQTLTSLPPGHADVPAAHQPRTPGQALMRWVEKLASFPLACEPGTQFHYGHGLDVVGLLIEVVSGKLLPDFLKEEIFDPLGMRDTAFDVSEAQLPRLSACYELVTTGTGDSPRLLRESHTEQPLPL